MENLKNVMKHNREKKFNDTKIEKISWIYLINRVFNSFNHFKRKLFLKNDTKFFQKKNEEKIMM